MLRQFCHRVSLGMSSSSSDLRARSRGASLAYRALLQFLALLRERVLAAVVRSDATKSLAVAGFYGICSVSMNFLNKTVVSSYEFNFPYFIMVCQMLVTVIFLDLLRLLGHLPLSPFTWKEGRELLPASLFFALHSTMSLSALHGMNIPMYGAIKRCTPLVSLVLSIVVLKKAAPSRYIIVSIFIITFGCLVAGFGDLQFDRHAYLMGTLSVFAQGGYLTLVQKYSETKSTLEMILINGYNTLPFFIVCSLLANEPRDILEAACLNDPGFYRAFTAVVVWGCALTFSQFLCASVCSALTASLVGVAKAALQTSIGFFTFGGVQFHPLIVLGLILNFLGGFMYTHVKYRENQARSWRKSSRAAGSSRPAGSAEDAERGLTPLLEPAATKKDHQTQVRMVNETAENLTHQL